MKRFAIAFVCSAIAASAMAINLNEQHGDRVGVLMVAEQNAPVTDIHLAESVLNDLRTELAARGFDAFRMATTVDALRPDDRPAAKYFVEIVASHGESNVTAGVGMAAGPIAGEVGLVIGRVVAAMRVYDGRTLELLDTFDLSQKHTVVAPTGIGIRGIPIFAFIAVPIAQRSQIRAATHAVARDAADRIAAGVHGQ
jgi:hypothetical protein